MYRARIGDPAAGMRAWNRGNSPGPHPLLKYLLNGIAHTAYGALDAHGCHAVNAKIE